MAVSDLVKWIQLDVDTLPDYTTTYATIQVSDLEPAVVWITRSELDGSEIVVSNDDLRPLVQDAISAFERQTGAEIRVHESGRQTDMGDAVCVMTYVLDGVAAGLLGAYATDLKDSVVRALKGPPPAALTEHRVNHQARLLLGHRFSVNPSNLTVTTTRLRRDSAVVACSSPDGSTYIAELSFGKNGAVILDEGTRQYPPAP